MCLHVQDLTQISGIIIAISTGATMVWYVLVIRLQRQFAFFCMIRITTNKFACVLVGVPGTTANPGL